MIEYRKGDLLAVTEGVIAHGVNCRGVMGAGVAAGIKEKYPTAYSSYKKSCDEALNTTGLQILLGKVQLVSPCKDGICNQPLLVIANCFTQISYGTEKRQVDYEAVAKCFATLNKRIPSLYEATLHIPKIGAGLAGGDWNVIEDIINSEYKSDIICWIKE